MRLIRIVTSGALALSLATVTVVTAHAQGCPEEMQPQTRRLRLIEIDGAARKRPTAIALAATALRAGRLQAAIALLSKAASTPISKSAPHGRDYIYAINAAQESAWALSGCP